VGILKCSFCGKLQEQVKRLVAGPGVYICDECVGLCSEIIEEENQQEMDEANDGHRDKFLDTEDTQESLNKYWKNKLAEKLHKIKESIKDLTVKEVQDLDDYYDKYVKCLNVYGGRTAGEGAGKIRNIRFKRAWDNEIYEFIFTTWDDKEYKYDMERQKRWLCNNVLISRNNIEEELEVWPGYLDAVEDFIYYFSHEECLLENRKRILEEECELKWEKLEEKLATDYSFARHGQLYLWRRKNPVDSKDVPAPLKNVRHVKKLEVIEPSHVYFLLKNNQVVYVGQTNTAWPQRILSHIKEGVKDFDDVWYLEVDASSLNVVEKEYIRKFKPKHNISSKPKIEQYLENMQKEGVSA
jgi:hypothetical protein